MVERFVTDAGTISIASGASTVSGTGTLFAGRDREGAQVWVQPAGAAPYRVGTVAAVDPRGVYGNLSLPLVHAWNGANVVNQPYEMIDGIALVSGATPAAIFARFSSQVERNFGLFGNLADDIDWSLVPNNSLFLDQVTHTLYVWRNGQLEAVYVVSPAFTVRGLWDDEVNYAANDYVVHDGAAYVSNAADNLNHEPAGTDAWWTAIPMPMVGELFAVSFFASGKPQAGELIGRFEFLTTVDFEENFAGGRWSAGVAADAEAVISICKVVADVPVEIGTVTYAAGSDDGVIEADAITFPAGDIMEVYAPSPRDATLANISGGFKGLRDGGQEVNALPKSGGQMTGPVDFKAWINLASAATLDLGAVAGNLVNITGNTGPITSFGTAAAGVARWVKFASNPTLTHSANIILLGAANWTAAAGASMLLISEGSGVWRTLFQTRQSGKPTTNPTLADISDASASGRLLMAGVRGADIFKMLAANDAGGTNVNTAQPWFPTAGAVAVAAATTYFFEGILRLSRAAGAVSHTTGILFGGTATLTNIDYMAMAKEGDANDLQDLSAFWASAATELVVKAASTSTTEQILIKVQGIIRINAAGTLIPQFKYSAVPGGTPTVLRGSYFRMFPVGDNTVGSAGTWS